MATEHTGPTEAPLWIRAAISEDAFAHEQRSLGKLWTFVGCLMEIPVDGDWFRTVVGGRSIFVQRFGDQIRAFENRCAHRFYPLRTKDKGNGPILCGFHHWRYNQDGQAIGIPNCPEMFGKIPREMDAKIERMDLDTCGDLIFVRWANDEQTETLQEFLSDGYDILRALCTPKLKPYRFSQPIKAHWKFSHHISLDDYHLVAVHPSSFGKDGYIDPVKLQYQRFGRHSAYMHTDDKEAFAKTLQGCRKGNYVPGYYAILNLFPNFLISQFRVPDVFGTDHWYLMILRYVPLSSSTSEVEARLFEVPFPVPQKPLTRLFSYSVDRAIPPIAAHFAKKIMMEDNIVCEGQQAIARQVTGEQTLAAHELRIGWFEEAYRAALEGQPMPTAATVSEAAE